MLILPGGLSRNGDKRGREIGRGKFGIPWRCNSVDLSKHELSTKIVGLHARSFQFGESRVNLEREPDSLDIEFLILRDRFINSMIRDGYRRIDVCRMLLLDRYERKRVYSLKTIENDQLSILIFTRFVNVKIGSFSFRPSAPPFFLFLFLLFVNNRGQILQLIGTSFNSSKIH